MSKPLSIDIYCNGNGQIGYGHIRRSSALAAGLQKENIHVRLLGISEEAKNLLPPVNKTNHTADIVLFDVPEGIDEQIRLAKHQQQITVTLDWFGAEIPDVNIAVFPHAEVRALRNAYIGFEYIIIRDEILRSGSQKQHNSTNNVIVCLGGADLLGQGYKTADLLYSKGFNVTLIQGPLAVNHSARSEFVTIINPPDFSDRLANCDWVVTNGGGCLFEANYLGKPAFVLPQTEWEEKIAEKALAYHAILGVGSESLKHLISDLSAKKLFTQDKRFVDGKGTERIIQIIKNLL